MKNNMLKRNLSSWHGYALMIGGMIGSGIFVVTGQAGAQAGPSVPLGYIVLLPVLLSSALAYLVFLSTPLGNSPGGAYTHISRTFNNNFVGFIFMWFQFIALLGVMAVISISFGDYLAQMLQVNNPLLLASILLIFFYLINIVDVKWFGKLQLWMTIILLFSIAILVIPGLFFIDHSNFQPLMPYGINGFIAILPSLFFAYFGFEQLAQAGGELKDSQKTMPKTMFRGTVITMVLYVLISYVAFGVLPHQQLASSSSAMLDVSKVYLPSIGIWVVNIGILMAFATTLNSLIMVVSRIIYSFAEDGVIPSQLSKVHPKFGTPIIALSLNTIIVLVFLWTHTMDFALSIALQGMFLMYIGHSISMIALPFIRPSLYESALFKPSKMLLVICGLFSVTVLLIFSFKMILSVWSTILIWSIVGIGLFGLGKMQSKFKVDSPKLNF
ncbi:amino acid permease [Cytobacillus suaedae]|nr:amino acid permease [Cytobacillus suaedae]